MSIRKYFPGEQRYPRSSSQDNIWQKIRDKTPYLKKMLVVSTIQTNRQSHGQNRMEQMVSQIIYENAYQRKTTASTLTQTRAKRQPQRKLELVRANMPHRNKIMYNIQSKWQTSNVHILWDCNMHIAYYSPIM